MHVNRLKTKLNSNKKKRGVVTGTTFIAREEGGGGSEVVKQKVYYSKSSQTASARPSGIGRFEASGNASKFADCKVMRSEMLERVAE